jgi:hypothetical protein|nr:MAG TPA: hypothetical protein [Caudoviricetes sp.]
MNTENYPTWLVPLDIAKELKDIGFDTPCSFYYDEKLLKISPWHDEEFAVTNWNDELFHYCVSLPTWEQVFQWFRGKGMFHSISIVNDLLEEVKYFETEICDNNGDIICIISRVTYEEAREELVKTLIRTYKNEQL